MSYDFVLPEKFYVAVQERTGFSTDTFPLGFATHVGTDKAFAKRKETVDSWAGINRKTEHYWLTDANGQYIKDDKGIMQGGSRPLPEHKGFMTFDNVPIEGFSFDRVVTRYRTDNKLFRIQDPRGFTLEISSENLGDVLLNSSISKGYFVGEYVWARTAGKNYLLRTDHPIYLELTKTKGADELTIRVGDVIECKDGKLKYFGKFYFAQKKDITQYYYDNVGGWQDKPNYSYSYGGSRLKKRRNVTKYSKLEKPYHVFMMIGRDYYKDRIIVKSSLPKKFDKTTIPDDQYIQTILPTAEWVGTDSWQMGDVKIFVDKKSLNEYPLPDTKYGEESS